MSTLVVCITNTVRRLSRTVNSIANTVKSEGSPELSMTSSYHVVKNMERNAQTTTVKSFWFSLSSCRWKLLDCKLRVAIKLKYATTLISLILFPTIVPNHLFCPQQMSLERHLNPYCCLGDNISSNHLLLCNKDLIQCFIHFLY